VCTSVFSLTVFDDVYSGIGTTKLEAKLNAAANAVDALQSCGVIAARERERRADRREADWLKRHAELPPVEIPQYDHRMFGQLELPIFPPNIDCFFKTHCSVFCHLYS